MKKILIIGGTGFIGINLIKKLKANYKIISVSLNNPMNKERIKGIKYIVCDITSKKQIENKINLNFDYIINLGGYIDHTNKKKTFQTHFQGCKNLIDFFKKKKVKKFIQIGTSLEYGPAKVPHKEDYNCKPKGNYGKAKYLASQYVKNNLKSSKLKFYILRLYQVYGPYQNQRRLLPIVINNCLKDKKFPCSSGIQIRDLLFVEDFVDLIKIILKRIKLRT